ncbi:MAG TPA: lipid-A-disaccharide synthase N-terminal domain-containing protein [Draconibacterium sp.]|nr:lipid-A-disaccharide synthase N-terminal domain-containing protein [Draconibacterium sp.]
MDHILIITLGFLAQILFFIRIIAQWFKSEKEGEVLSPVIFWQISLVASILMLTYGILRHDFAIVFGQLLVYLIYIRNLQLKNAWKSMHWLARLLAVVVPLGYVFWLIFSGNFTAIFKNEEITAFWLIWGTVAQVVFISRFFYQWIFSEKEKDSVFPLGFWVISIIGSIMIFTYSIPRLDPVLFASHGFGIFVYSRNILLHYGKRSLFSNLDQKPIINKIIGKVSDKIK